MVESAACRHEGGAGAAARSTREQPGALQLIAPEPY